MDAARLLHPARSVLSRWRRVVISRVLTGAVLAGLIAAGCGGVDPAPPNFLIGASVRDGGTVDVHVVECPGGTLRSFGVSQIEADNSRTPLWKIDGGGSGGIAVARGQTQTVTVGSVPTGMSEVTSLAAPLPRDKEIAVSVNFTTQPDASVGFFFKVNAIEPGKTWIDVGDGKNLSPQEFQEEAKATCGPQ